MGIEGSAASVKLIEDALNDYNGDVRAYNSKVLAHDAKVENQRRRLNVEIRRLNSRPAATTFVTYRTSVETLTRSYDVTEERLAGAESHSYGARTRRPRQ